MRLPKVDDVYYWATPYGTDNTEDSLCIVTREMRPVDDVYYWATPYGTDNKEDSLCIVTREMRPEDSTYTSPGRYACGVAHAILGDSWVIAMSCFEAELNSGRLTYLGNLED